MIAFAGSLGLETNRSGSAPSKTNSAPGRGDSASERWKRGEPSKSIPSS